MKPTSFFAPSSIHPGRVSGLELRPLPADIVKGAVYGMQAVILAALIDGPRNTGWLLEAIYNYGEREPATGRHSFYNAICELRTKLRPDWCIEQEPDPTHPRWHRRYVLRRI